MQMVNSLREKSKTMSKQEKEQQYEIIFRLGESWENQVISKFPFGWRDVLDWAGIFSAVDTRR